MEYDRVDSVPFDFEPNQIPFGKKLKAYEFEPDFERY